MFDSTGDDSEGAGGGEDKWSDIVGGDTPSLAAITAALRKQIAEMRNQVRLRGPVHVCA